MNTPLVSVKVLAYNHEKYIAQCLEGILMQKTDFPFEVIVGEDCSSDRTREIVFAYQAKYPNQMRVITAEKNVGGIANAIRVLQACRGKYQASCEGDDYWIDPLKLQKQFDCMESHPEASMCFHNAFILNVKTGGTALFFHSPVGPFVSFDEMLAINLPLASIFARSDVLATLPEWRRKVLWGDVVLRLWCADKGPAAYLPDIMAVYRVHNQGATAAAKASPHLLENIRFMHEQLDKDTGYRYTHGLQARLRRVQQRHRANKNKWLFALTHPRWLLEQIRFYRHAFQRLNSVIHFGNSTDDRRRTKTTSGQKKPS